MVFVFTVGASFRGELLVYITHLFVLVWCFFVALHDRLRTLEIPSFSEKIHMRLILSSQAPKLPTLANQKGLEHEEKCPTSLVKTHLSYLIPGPLVRFDINNSIFSSCLP